MEQKKMRWQDTIVAVATAPVQSGVAVVRMSGPESLAIADGVWRGRQRVVEMQGYQAAYGMVRDEDGEVLDRGIITVFRAPHSYTGEDTVEFSLHGSPWIASRLLSVLVAGGARPAEGGEFTRRAFLNGKLDLAQAEGVADLIAAGSAASHRLAESQMSGRFSKRLAEMRSRLVDFASMLELELDFSEEDVEFADRDAMRRMGKELIELICTLASTYKAGKAFKDGVPVVIAGLPNVGKSTLLNALLDDDKAIVSEVAGTTRDVVEDECEIRGVKFRIADTAGLRISADKVEEIGIERARTRLKRSAIIIWVYDSTSDHEAQMDEHRLLMKDIEPWQTVVTVLGKCDIASEQDKYSVKEEVGQDIVEISALRGDGIDELRNRLYAIATNGHNPDNEIIVTNERHYVALLSARESLQRAMDALEAGISGDMLAQDIREATHALGGITGEVTSDTLLSNIFSRFCIGK